MRRINLLRGLTSVCSACLALAIIMTNTALGYSSMLNSALGTSSGKLVPVEGEESPVFMPAITATLTI